VCEPAPARGARGARAKRKEQSAIPEASVTTEAAGGASAAVVVAQHVRMFESDIDPLTLGLLDGGQFVLFRNAWRDGQRYIQGRVKQAMATGSSLALASAAFLAVYREGFETVLFYQALLAGAENARSAVAVGFGAGCVVLAIVAGVFRVLGVRLPIRPFFLVTGALLYAMSVVFVGKGVHELQEAGVLGVTNVPSVPRIDFLGVFPTLETLLAQGVLIACVLYGVMVALRRPGSGGATPKPKVEVAERRDARESRSA